MDNSSVLDALYKTILDRKNADPKKSYVAQLYKKGSKQIAKKMGEEAVELVIEAIRLEGKKKDGPKKDKRRDAFQEEAADLLFHMLVLMAHHDVEPNDVFRILQKRLGIGGLEEKASRK